MTTKEKLEKALEALKYIAEGKCEFADSDEMYAATVYNELTAPRIEEVEYKADPHSPNSVWYKDERGYTVKPPEGAEITIKFKRSIPEPETWEGKVFCSHKDGGWLKGLPNEWIGKRVIVEVCE